MAEFFQPQRQNTDTGYARLAAGYNAQANKYMQDAGKALAGGLTRQSEINQDQANKRALLARNTAYTGADNQSRLEQLGSEYDAIANRRTPVSGPDIGQLPTVRGYTDPKNKESALDDLRSQMQAIDTSGRAAFDESKLSALSGADAKTLKEIDMLNRQETIDKRYDSEQEWKKGAGDRAYSLWEKQQQWKKDNPTEEQLHKSQSRKKIAGDATTMKTLAGMSDIERRQAELGQAMVKDPALMSRITGADERAIDEMFGVGKEESTTSDLKGRMRFIQEQGTAAGIPQNDINAQLSGLESQYKFSDEKIVDDVKKAERTSALKLQDDFLRNPEGTVNKFTKGSKEKIAHDKALKAATNKITSKSNKNAVINSLKASNAIKDMNLDFWSFFGEGQRENAEKAVLDITQKYPDLAASPGAIENLLKQYKQTGILTDDTIDTEAMNKAAEQMNIVMKGNVTTDAELAQIKKDYKKARKDAVGTIRKFIESSTEVEKKLTPREEFNEYMKNRDKIPGSGINETAITNAPVVKTGTGIGTGTGSDYSLGKGNTFKDGKVTTEATEEVEETAIEYVPTKTDKDLAVQNIRDGINTPEDTEMIAAYNKANSSARESKEKIAPAIKVNEYKAGELGKLLDESSLMGTAARTVGGAFGVVKDEPTQSSRAISGIASKLRKDKNYTVPKIEKMIEESTDSKDIQALNAVLHQKKMYDDEKYREDEAKRQIQQAALLAGETILGAGGKAYQAYRGLKAPVLRKQKFDKSELDRFDKWRQDSFRGTFPEAPSRKQKIDAIKKRMSDKEYDKILKESKNYNYNTSSVPMYRSGSNQGTVVSGLY